MPKQGRASRTAESLLEGVWLTACDPATRYLVDPEIASYTGSALKALRNPLAWLLELGPVRWLARRREGRTLPGICGHWAARKGTILNLAKEIELSAIVVLGAGLDGLAYRFAAEIPAYEIDWPASQERKKRLLAHLPYRPVGLAAADLSDPNPDLNLDLPDETLFVIEGVLMYLPEVRVRSLLSLLSSRGKAILFTFMDISPTGRPAFHDGEGEVRRYLEQSGEPFLWGLNADSVERFVDSTGWTLTQTSGAPNDDLPNLNIVPGMIAGEWIVYARSKSTSM